MTTEELNDIARAFSKARDYYKEYAGRYTMGEGALRGIETAIFCFADDMFITNRVKDFNRREFLLRCGID